MIKVIYEEEQIPKFYGVAYRDFTRMRVVCYPIPLNLLVRAGINVWFYFKGPHNSNSLERREALIYARAKEYYRGRL